MNIEQVSSGNLLLTLEDSDDVEDLKRLVEERGEQSVWHDLFEPYFTNGSYTPVDPNTHYFGLTDDPYMVCESVTYEDNGDITIEGSCFHFPNYMLDSALDRLLNYGEVFLKVWHKTQGPELRECIL